MTASAGQAAAVVAVGYVRRSVESDARAVSLETQRAAVERYCLEQGWALAAVVEDDGVSGGKRERLVRLDGAVRRHRAGAVVVYALDRLARHTASLLDRLEGWGKRRVAVHVVGRGPVDVATADGELQTTLFAAMDAHYRRKVGERTRDALARLRATGRAYSGVPPYGYRHERGRVVAVGCCAGDGASLDAQEAAVRGYCERQGWALAEVVRLVPDAGEQRALAVMRELRAAGHGYRALAVELAERGHAQRNGRPWSAQLLHRVLRRQPMDLSADAAVVA